uniref:Sodium/potassium-transporting ATPase subunit alpha-1 (Trinotate prediction) n=1 Tax=Henneguya salminicola TaxID=69463 RepID=A0A6G3MIE3_HENSL
MTTDLIPAISLAYEKPEMNIMSRKPRNVKKDKLVGWKLIRFAFLLIGTLQTLASMLSYLYLTMDNGFFWNELQLRSKWSHKNVLYVTDTYGQEWSYVARHELEYRCHSAYYLSIVMIQWSDLLISKTRSMSIFTHGIFNNKILIFGLFSETILSLIFVYVPFCNIFLKTRPFNPKYLIPALIFAVLLWIFDELRRYFIRNYPKSFLTRETYY